MESFKELQISPAIMKAVEELGFEKPTPIQAEAFPILLGEPTDFLGLAATGTGKTVAFSIPMLERINPDQRHVQALILCPTRELALQVSGQINLLGKHMGVRALPVYGGTGYGDQIGGLKRGVSVVVGTPGRVLDHLEKGTLRIDGISTLILDEADEMISMGFKEEIETVLSYAPGASASASNEEEYSEDLSDEAGEELDGSDESEARCNIWLFSATMSREIRRIASDFLRDPKQVQINKTEMLSEGVEQLFYVTSESNKPEILCKLIDAADDFYGIIFCQTKSLVADLTRYLLDRDYKVDCLHGDMEQNARERTMQAFRDHKVQMLICTDVASRGLDVKDITHVINYSIPRELDSYVHRIGRTARSGKKGYAMSLVTPSHRGLVGRIEKMTKSQMKEGRVPTRKEIGIKKVAQVLAKFDAEQNAQRAIDLLSPEWKASLAAMSSEEVAGRLLSMMYPEIFSDNRAAKEEAAKAAAEAAPRGQVLVAGSVAPVRLSGDRPSFGGHSGDRPSYGDRPSFRDRPRFNRSERSGGYGERQSYGDRPSFKERGGFNSGFGSPRGEFARDRRPSSNWGAGPSERPRPSQSAGPSPIVSKSEIQAAPVAAPIAKVTPGAFGKSGKTPGAFGKEKPASGKVPGAFGKTPGAFGKSKPEAGKTPGAFGEASGNVPGAFGKRKGFSKNSSQGPSKKAL